MATFNIGLIGAGGIASAHVGAARSSGGAVAIVAVADPHPDNLAKVVAASGAVAQFTGAEKLFDAYDAGLDLDGILIATPPSVRLKFVEHALKRGLPVLTEKPIAHTRSEARKLAALAAKHSKAPAFVGYCHRFAPAVLEIKRLIDAGRIGMLTRFENVFACDLPGHKDKWFSDPKKAGGGAYLDMGSHSLDLYRYFVGDATTLGAVFTHKWPRRSETAATVLLRSTKKHGKYVPAGVAGSIISGWAETSRFTVAAVGDAGMLFYDYERPSEIVFKDLSGKAESIPVESHDVRFTRQLLAFAAGARARGAARFKAGLATFADGLAAAELGEQAVKLAGKK